ncbi:MAG TPA: hypothetical protein VHB25_09330 [Gemmatimonadaceae bacterium]|nr:hypothetical protein [Gemmatimonadaceae bacterium]
MRRVRAVAVALTCSILSSAASAQSGGFGVCKPVAQRTQEIGCWIIAEHAVGRIEAPNVYWHLDAYPSMAAAERARGPRGTVLRALGRSWLMTIERQDWRPKREGEHVADIGPLVVKPGRSYAALFMEAVTTPGMTSAVHRHSGPEAWYTTAGETCLETPSGTIIGRAGAPAIVPEGPPMYLTAIGSETRRAITLILHDAKRAPTTEEHDWKPKGLCK